MMKDPFYMLLAIVIVSVATVEIVREVAGAWVARAKLAAYPMATVASPDAQEEA